MPVNLVSEEALREALRPLRVDAADFEAGVLSRLSGQNGSGVEPVTAQSAALRAAAAVLPLELLSVGPAAIAAIKQAPAAGLSKLLGYAMLPAISLFVLLGAAVYSLRGARRLVSAGRAPASDAVTAQQGLGHWWREHRWQALTIYVATLALSLVGATWMLFLVYVGSLALLGRALTALARAGFGNRWVVGTSCLAGLLLLGQVAGSPTAGYQEIHFVDPSLVTPVFFGGWLVVACILAGSVFRWRSLGAAAAAFLAPLAMLPAMAVLMIVFAGQYGSAWPWPPAPARIAEYVESFDSAPFSSSSWRRWEIVANWTIDRQLDLPFLKPRRLLAEELKGKQNPLILGCAFRAGLVGPKELAQLHDYARQRQFLLATMPKVLESRPFTSLGHEDWVIRAAAMHDDLTDAERDYLADRLRATLRATATDQYATLEEALRSTQLLSVIGRPVDVEKFRGPMHQMLLRFHSTTSGGFELAGGFRQYAINKIQVGDLVATAYAVQLMAIYGVPQGLDLNWVRSYLRPTMLRGVPERWIAAVSLDRLNRLPDAARPSWLQIVYYERSLLAAVVLVGLCVYATLISPLPTVGQPQAMPTPAG